MIKNIVIDVDYILSTAKIVEQTHKGREFGIDGTDFKSSTGFTLSSQIHPEYRRYMRDFTYMRGSDRSQDNVTLRFEDKRELNGFINAVREYNEYFNPIPDFKKELDRILDL